MPGDPAAGLFIPHSQRCLGVLKSTLVWCLINNWPSVALNLTCGKTRRRKHPRSPDMSGGLRSNTATGQVGRNPLGGHSLRRMLCCSILTYLCGYASAFALCPTARQASLAPRVRHKSIAADGQLFMRHHTSTAREGLSGSRQGADFPGALGSLYELPDRFMVPRHATLRKEASKEPAL
jgi:hypothetical protein